jgi:CheY-like chemotaxis protein
MERMKTVLVVDDDDYTRDILEESLRWSGLNVRTAGTGQEALDAAASAPVDAVIMDIMMPGLDGFVVTRLLRERWGEVEIPIIFLSARCGTEDKIRGLHLGGDYVTKPFDPDELVARVQAHLRQKELIERLAEQREELAAVNRIILENVARPLRRAREWLAPPEAGPVTGERQQAVQRELDGIQAVLDGFLALSAAEVDPTAFRPIALGEVANRARDEVLAGDLASSLADEAGSPPVIRIEGALPQVMGEPELLTEAFRQLLLHALRFRRPEVRPTIVITARELDDGMVVEVADNGRGIPRDLLGRAFAPGASLWPAPPYDEAGSAAEPGGAGDLPMGPDEAALMWEPPEGEKGGLGFALPVVRRIVESHGGRVWADSRLMQGTRVQLMFPKSALADAALVPSPLPGLAPPPATV